MRSEKEKHTVRHRMPGAVWFSASAEPHFSSLSKWTYYAPLSAGVSIAFDPSDLCASSLRSRRLRGSERNVGKGRFSRKLFPQPLKQAPDTSTLELVIMHLHRDFHAAAQDDILKRAGNAGDIGPQDSA